MPLSKLWCDVLGAHCWNSLRPYCHFVRYALRSRAPLEKSLHGQAMQCQRVSRRSYVTIDRFRRCVKRSSQLLAEDSNHASPSFSFLPLNTVGQNPSFFLVFSCIIANQGKWGLRFRIKAHSDLMNITLSSSRFSIGSTRFEPHARQNENPCE